MKTLIIGLGNPLVGDDSVGLRVAAELAHRLAERPDIVVEQEYCGGLRLMERMIGYDRVIVIDAMVTGLAPGSLQWLTVEALPTQHTASAHDVNLATALAIGRHAGAKLPPNEAIWILGIEAQQVVTFSEECTPAVAQAIPKAVAAVLEKLSDPAAPGPPPGSRTSSANQAEKLSAPASSGPLPLGILSGSADPLETRSEPAAPGQSPGRSENG
jgi:hydrogenase maturation protease